MVIHKWIINIGGIINRTKKESISDLGLDLLIGQGIFRNVITRKVNTNKGPIPAIIKIAIIAKNKIVLTNIHLAIIEITKI